MGGPKGLLRIGELPILEYVLDQLKWPGPTWLITAPGREHPPGWERFDRELHDPIAGLGPLRGVLTALDELRTPLLVVMTVDMPGAEIAHLKWLLSQLNLRPECLGVMCRRRDAGIEKVEPFPLALRAEARPVIEHRLAAHRRSVMGLLEEPDFIGIPAPAEWDAAVWTNLNDAGDFARFVKRGEE
jgi:molybdopterin-guanine dinucleotide biosynthesis protein A